MSEPWKPSEPAVAPEQVVGTAIQDLTATRLGRGFIPLGLMAVTAVIELVRGAGAPAWVLGLGAIAAGVAMLGYGLRISERAFGRKDRLWMSLAMLGSVIPPTFAVYVLGWRGLRGFVTGGGLLGIVGAVYFLVVGVWVMRSWMRVVEVERLARAMAIGLPGEGHR